MNQLNVFLESSCLIKHLPTLLASYTCSSFMNNFHMSHEFISHTITFTTFFTYMLPG